ncbi:MAG: MptD family putative ECF transporter S component [Methanobacteriaceae archaeon]|jgi:energy-coupling factor transport system substrate-specific component|nr:MptD family putative ECF transporter S component [Methanobacteriaceae archaeon]
MNNSLNVQDLITTGIFTAIFIIVVFAFGMIGYIPIFMAALPLLVAIVGGIPFMLFLTKVKKFGMVTILAFIVGLIMFLSGHTWTPILTFLIFGIIADFIFKSGSYRSRRMSILGYGVFCMASIGNMLPMWIMKETWVAQMTSQMGAEYINSVIWMVQDWVFVVLLISAFVGGIVGAYIGEKVLDKHFKKAGFA